MVLGYTQGKRIDWFLGYLVKLVVRPWNCFNRFVYILFWPSLCQRPPPIDVKMTQKLEEEIPYLESRHFSRFQSLSVVQFRGVTISPRVYVLVNHPEVIPLCSSNCVRPIGLESQTCPHFEVFWFWATCLSVQDVCRFFFFGDLFFVSFDISRLKPNSLRRFLFLLIHICLMKPPTFL